MATRLDAKKWLLRRGLRRGREQAGDENEESDKKATASAARA
jgi:hypothetical protein